MASPSLQFPNHIPSSTSFETPLPSNLSFDLTINEGLLQLDLRVLRPITPKSSPVPSHNPSHTSLFALANSATKLVFKAPQGIGGETYHYQGQEVIVIEQVRVSSADPNFIAVLAKLAVLEERINMLRGKVEIVALGAQKTY
jgi:Rogdi leucine zipper containing protein